MKTLLSKAQIYLEAYPAVDVERISQALIEISKACETIPRVVRGAPASNSVDQLVKKIVTKFSTFQNRQ